jgi:hypothetical protein
MLTIFLNRTFAVTLVASGLFASSADASNYSKEIRPLIQEYCFDCHGEGMKKGDISLDDRESEVTEKTWERVLNILERHEMPPKKKAQPSPAERHKLMAWIEREALGCDCDTPDPGRVTIRRLNRAEYNNTIRELLGVDFKPARDFPVDDSGYGFDNIGDALSVPPVLLEKYLAAADRIVDTAFGLNQESEPEKRRYPVDLLEVGYNARQRGDGWVALNSIEEDDVAVALERSLPAEYRVRVHAYARQESTNAMKLTFMLDKTPVEMVMVETNQHAAKTYETRMTVPPGPHRLRAVVRRVKDGLSAAEALRWKSGPQQKGAIFVEWMEIEGPFPVNGKPAEATIALPKAGEAAAREFIERFAKRAYRRPLAKDEVEDLMRLSEAAWKRGSSYPEGIAVASKAVLISPHFLFRGEIQPDPNNPKAVQPVNEFALASRLSYFLWSGMPDADLFAEAERGTLRKNLERQVRRMLADERAGALVENFAGQWLELRNITQIAPDDGKYRDFDEALREAMRQETEMLFAHIMREDRSVLEFLNADYSFLNERLAKHYGMKGIAGDEFRKVSLAETPRRGVLTHGSVLAITSNPTRTSPVKRGKWVLDNLLNAPPPPPPPEIPELKEGKEASGTLRQRLEQHRENVLCASCHARMDPLGFGLENFDGVGKWRTEDQKEKIDASGELTTGEKFTGPLELVEILSGPKREQFVRCLSEKMLIYALGRGLEVYDRCAVKKIVSEVAQNDHRFSALVLAVAQSTPFQMRRGDDRKSLAAKE